MTQPSFARSATEGRPGLLRQKRYGGQARGRVNAELQTFSEEKHGTGMFALRIARLKTDWRIQEWDVSK